MVHSGGVHSPHLGTVTTTQQQQQNHAADNAKSYAETIEALHELHCWDFPTGELPQALTGAAADVLSDLDWDAENYDLDSLDYSIMDYVQQMPLTVMVRSDWQPLGGSFQAQEFQILLSTGGPACRILGELDRGSVAWQSGRRPVIQYQDWFKPWTESDYDVNTDALLWFCEQFYYGE